jgi:DNA polymerase-3 subunit alpha
MFDGFDKIGNIVAHAKELGHPAVGLSDHGNACGILQLYRECNAQGIKPIMGIEAYFVPDFNHEEPENLHYHLGLFAQDAEGYASLCNIISEANLNFYKKMHVTFDILARFSKGVICTSACVGGIIPQMIMQNKPKRAKNLAKKFQKIFGDNFYFEIMPIKIDDLHTQEDVNEALMQMGAELGIKCIITTDSHFTKKTDFDSYIMMHKMSHIGSAKGEGFTIDHIVETYQERFMHSEKQIIKMFENMHDTWDVDELLDNMTDLYDSIDMKLDFAESIPECNDYANSEKELKKICVQNLKETDRYEDKYIERMKYEVSVIKKHGLCDYFLIVRDYVQFAKTHNIYVGPGRGSCGGSLVTDLLGITEIDPIVLGTDFERFLRADKKKMPDIDIDFETSGQGDVIQYVLDKYDGCSSKIMTFGYYKSANLINDLAKVYDLGPLDISDIKKAIQPHVPEMAHFEFEDIVFADIMKYPDVKYINSKHKDFVKHFCALCGQVRYYGQHPAGVIVTKGSITSWVPMMRVKDMIICSYDKYDIEAVDMLKFDILALRTLDVIHDIERKTHDKFDRTKLDKKTQEAMYNNFRTGNTYGVFQLNKAVARDILQMIDADNIQDIIAAISLNRPGTLKLKTHLTYAESKKHVDKTTAWYPYTKDAYGSIIYQEHVMRICKGLANMDPMRVDKLMKFKFSEDEREGLKQEFIAGAKETSGIKASVSCQLFDAMALYMFNKGHGAGYALISEWQMYHKTVHPNEFWCATLKYAPEVDYRMLTQMAIKDGTVILLPHVNGGSSHNLITIEGDLCIREGLVMIKKVGLNAAKFIVAERKANGLYKDRDDFLDRMEGHRRNVNSGAIEAMTESGALEFNLDKYYERCAKYNTSLYIK